MTISSEEIASRAEDRAELNAVKKVLKSIGVTQNEIARLAGYSSGYTTQMLSNAYPVVKLTSEATRRLATAQQTLLGFHGRRFVGPEFDDANSRVAAMLAKYGSVAINLLQAGKPFTPPKEGTVSNYIPRPLDAYINTQVQGAKNRRVFMHDHITGSAGMGKSWFLGMTALRQSNTHAHVPVDLKHPQHRGHSPTESIVRQIVNRGRRHEKVHGHETITMPSADELSGEPDALAIGMSLLWNILQQEPTSGSNANMPVTPGRIMVTIDHLDAAADTDEARVISDTLDELSFLGELVDFYPELGATTVLSAGRLGLEGAKLQLQLGNFDQPEIEALVDQYGRGTSVSISKGNVTDVLNGYGGNPLINGLFLDSIVLNMPKLIDRAIPADTAYYHHMMENMLDTQPQLKTLVSPSIT